jgi:DNA-binding MarR family transcriptional regulator
MRYETLTANFGRIWPVHVDAFTELLIQLRQAFSGDLDRMLILGIIGSRTMPSPRFDGVNIDQFAQGEVKPGPRPINAQSIAECSGIPRETVRRKLQALERSGWVERDANGSLFVSRRAAADLYPMTEASLDYLLRICTACKEIKRGG